MSDAVSCLCLIVERRPRWGPVVARMLGERLVRVVECRSLAECLARLEESPTSIVAIDIDVCAAGELAAAVLHWRRRFPAAAIAVLGVEADAPAALLLQEAGAALVCPALHRLDGLERLLERHLASRPQRPAALREAILARLPWRAVDAGRSLARPIRKRKKNAAPDAPSTLTEAAAADEPVEFEPLTDD